MRRALAVSLAAAVILGLLAAEAGARVSAKRNLRVVVAVVDTGVDARDPALRGALVAGHSFVAAAPTTDPVGHGTAVAALVVAGCRRCAVMPVRVLDGSDSTTPGTLAKGIEWAVDAGATVVNLSVSMQGPDDGVAAAVAYALAHGVAVVSSAGNDGIDRPTYPAAYPGVVSVAGTDPHGARAAWSNYGDWVTVAARGCSVVQGAHGAYVRFCGTSSAAAFVSGMIASALSTSTSTSPAAAVTALDATARPVGAFVHYGVVDSAKKLLRTIAASTKKT